MDSFRRTCAMAGFVMLAGVSGADARSIMVVTGTYGANCGAASGNATRDLTRQCDGRDTCAYVPTRTRGGDAVRACRKDLRVDWRCTDSEFHTAMLSPGADANSTLVLSCIEQSGPGR
ncbi:hypothetical protein [Caballeronia pedi]|nr:hypothetical protein [Caballeronia pedi]